MKFTTHHQLKEQSFPRISLQFFPPKDTSHRGFQTMRLERLMMDSRTGVCLFWSPWSALRSSLGTPCHERAPNLKKKRLERLVMDSTTVVCLFWSPWSVLRSSLGTPCYERDERLVMDSTTGVCLFWSPWSPPSRGRDEVTSTARPLPGRRESLLCGTRSCGVFFPESNQFIVIWECFFGVCLGLFRHHQRFEGVS